MNAGPGIGAGPPDWAVARGHQNEAVVATPPEGEDTEDDGLVEHAPTKGNGGSDSGKTDGDSGDGAFAGSPPAGVGIVAKAEDRPADRTDAPSPKEDTPAATRSDGVAGPVAHDHQPATRDEALRFLPVSSAAAVPAAAFAPDAAPGATLHLVPAPDDPAGAAPAVIAAGRGAFLSGEAGSSAGGAVVAPVGGTGVCLPAGDEGLVEPPPGPTLSALGETVGATGAGLLNQFCPPPVLAELTTAVGQLAVLVEDEAGGGWEAWVVATGLAVAAGEVARRQLRRRAVRPWDFGGSHAV